MKVTLRYESDRDLLEARFSPNDPVRRARLAAGVDATFDPKGYICGLTIENFSRFHDFVPLDDAVGIEGIAAISQFQSDILQGSRRKLVTLSPKPMSRRKLDLLTAA